ncbi:hypothetical protein CLOP_g9170, partial [Closterium sp. NIES-67]
LIEPLRLRVKKIIRPSFSPFAAPILLTLKKDGGYRMCIDYRAQNRVSIKSCYPIPCTNKLIDQIRKARFFANIDLRGGYHLIRVVAVDCHKTAFRTWYESFEHVVMPFRLTNTLATFQMTMNQIFSSLVEKCVIVYLDNILIYSETREQHLKDLEAKSISTKEKARLFNSTVIHLHGIPSFRIVTQNSPVTFGVTSGNSSARACSSPPSIPRLTARPNGPIKRWSVLKIVEEPCSKPTFRAPYRLSPIELAGMKKHIEYLLAKGLIRPSTWPYGAPVLFTPKSDGSLRMCIDYRALNKQIIKNKYPIPQIDDLPKQLRGGTVFSKLDLWSGYWQIRKADNSIHKTAFRTRYRSYDYLVIPFGLTNTPATFLAEMNHILRPLLDECMVIYLDDILIYLREMKQHVEHLRRVFDIRRQERFYVKLSKSEFALKRVHFLGHMVSAQGFHVDPRKIEAVRTWKTPENMKELQQFLGCATYYNRFVPQYAKIAAPLMNLLKKNTPYKWEPRHEEAVELLKQELTSAPVLILPDPERDYVIEVDASNQAVGAILM